jgi:hypothetical protein
MYRDKLVLDPDDENSKDMIQYYLDFDQRRLEKESDPAWQQDNMEYDLRTSKYMVDKVRTSSNYAQNLYAAICNNEFQRNDTFPILQDKRWSCSWRYAGGILADMKGEGDYMDFYCSGIGPSNDTYSNHVGESVVTDEIRKDLFDLGWIVISDTTEF